MKFKFMGDPCTPIEGKPAYYSRMHAVEVEADSYEAALELAKKQWPADGRIWSGHSMEPLVLDENDQ